MASFASSATTGGAHKHAWTKNILKKDISSSYAKILGETNFRARELPQSGWKAEAVEEEEK